MSKVEIADRGEDFIVRAEQDGFGFVHLLVETAGGAKASMPRMTPFEADMVARLLSDAAELADQT